MGRFALAMSLVAANAVAQPAAPPVVSPVPSDRMQPGYGVIEEVTPVQVRERSAAAGGSSADVGGADAGQAWRVKVRMPDGSVQYRDLDRRDLDGHKFRPGDRVLLTNAGDVVPD